MKLYHFLPMMASVGSAVASALGLAEGEIWIVAAALFKLMTRVLIIGFVATLLVQGWKYRKDHDINWDVLIVEFVCIILSAGAMALCNSLIS